MHDATETFYMHQAGLPYELTTGLLFFLAQTQSGIKSFEDDDSQPGEATYKFCIGRTQVTFKSNHDKHVRTMSYYHI